MYRWQDFFRKRLKKIFNEKNEVVDIGNGLRVVKEKGNKYDPSREWLREYIEKVDYKVVDKVPDYNPDIVGDIHNLPFDDNSVESIICIAILEHVENPIQAAREIYRTLEPGGYAFVYIPFLYSYHAHASEGYYKDFWRFTKDSIDYIFRDFSTIEKVGVRGAFHTLLNLTPLSKFNLIMDAAHKVDKVFSKIKTNQASGYNIFLVK